MAFSFSPKIVTNGLVFYIDASNIKSYTSGSNIMYDLSVNQYTGSIINNPIYNTANGGSFIFDGLNDGSPQIIDCIDVSQLTNMTIELWILYTKGANQTDILTYNGTQGSYTFGSGGFPVFRTDGNNLPARSFSSSIPIPTGWFRLCYIKNSFLWLNDKKYDGTGTDRTYGKIKLADTRNIPTIGYWGGNIASCKIYNRNLSDAEVLQNYNALKPRFNLT